MTELIEKLKQDGEVKGLCRLWRGKLQPGMSIESLVELFIKGIDFCISEDYPTLDFMKAHFKDKCEPYGVYIDDTVSCSNAPDIVLNGASSAHLKYTDYSVSRLYIRHSSKAWITVQDNAILTVDAFDNTKLIINSIGDKIHILVNLYGNAQIDHIKDSNNIHIRKMNRETY